MTAITLSTVVPKNTLVASPLQVRIKVSPLIITNVSIGFPAGCVDLVRVWIDYQSARIFPINQDGYFVGNGQIITFTTETEIVEKPTDLVINYVNLDDTYQHTIWTLFDVSFIEQAVVESKIAVVNNSYSPFRIIR